MTKTSGLGAHFYVGGYDLSTGTASLDQISGGPALLDVTDITQSANARIGGLRSGGMQFTNYMDPAPGGEHAGLSTLPLGDVIAMFGLGATIGGPCAMTVSKQLNYDPTRTNTGALTEKTEVQSNAYGLEWGVLLTPDKRIDTAATAGASWDDGAASTFGAQGYLEVVAFTGTSVDVKIEHSADNSTWSTLMDFTAQSAIGALRGTAAGTVNRYVRATTGTGTFSSITFVVGFVRNLTAVTF